MTTIITTTGISLYLNANRIHPSPTDDQMRQYLRTKPEDASAEANSLLQFAQPEDSLVLLHTENEKAQICAKLLEDFFNKKGFRAVRVVPLQFQDNESQIETHGLRNLVDTIIHEIDDAEKSNEKVIINATAGLKAQIV